jgi:hypothetical protein
MPSTPADPPSSDRSEFGRRERGGADEPAAPAPVRASEQSARDTDTYGVLAIERRRKDDGRALILYTRRARGDAKAGLGTQAETGLEHVGE